jgi:hypothetical protein
LRVRQNVAEGGVHEALQLGISSIGLCRQAGLSPAFRREAAAARVWHPDLDWSKPSLAKGSPALAYTLRG